MLLASYPQLINNAQRSVVCLYGCEHSKKKQPDKGNDAHKDKKNDRPNEWGEIKQDPTTYGFDPWLQQPIPHVADAITKLVYFMKMAYFWQAKGAPSCSRRPRS